VTAKKLSAPCLITNIYTNSNTDITK